MTSRIRIPRQLTSLARVVLVSETVLIAVRAGMLLLSCIIMATRVFFLFFFFFFFFLFFFFFFL